MRNALLATAGSALALALLCSSMPASADVTVLANITKTKDTTITENITITKIVDIQVGQTSVVGTNNETRIEVVPLLLVYRSAAEADAIVNQTASNNDVDSAHNLLNGGISHIGAVNTMGIHLSATMTNSTNRNTGIVGVNQDVGNMSNQGNQVALAVATPATALPPVGTVEDTTNGVLVNSQSEAQQNNWNNFVYHGEIPQPTATSGSLVSDPVDYRGGPNEVASITGSINNNTGIVNVNQNAGNMNNQGNSEALAVAIDLAGFALSEAALGQENSNAPQASHSPFGTVFEYGVQKSASMSGSLNSNVGVGGVNQAAGNMANQANIFSASFIDGGGGVGLGGTD
jgi:hypothetical protein